MATVSEIKDSLDGILKTVANVGADVQSLHDQIKALQDQINAGGPVTAQDLQDIADKAAAIQAALSAVDQATP